MHVPIVRLPICPFAVLRGEAQERNRTRDRCEVVFALDASAEKEFNHALSNPSNVLAKIEALCSGVA